MEEIKCPNCGTILDEDRYCEKCMATIPLPSNDVDVEDINECDNQESINVESCADEVSNETEIICSECGAPGVVGKACCQCGTIIQENNLDTQPSQETVDYPKLIFPDGQIVKLCDGKDYCLGRESDTEEIKKLLFTNKYVSRQHCSIRVDLNKSIVYVKDLKSANGTYCQQGNKRITEEESFNIPFSVWLGSKPNTRVEIAISL